MSYLTVKQKNHEKLKIQESELLESIQNIRTRILKSDLDSAHKPVIEKQVRILEDCLKDFYALEIWQAKKVMRN